MKRAWNYLSYQNLIYTHACLIGWILTNYVCQMKTIYIFTLSLFAKRRKLQKISHIAQCRNEKGSIIPSFLQIPNVHLITL